MKQSVKKAEGVNTKNMNSESKLKFLSPSQRDWKPLNMDSTDSSIHEQEDRKRIAGENREELKQILLSSLQMHNLAVLAGSGTSLGQVGGPSMKDLWIEAVNDGGDEPTESSLRVIEKVNYENSHGENIEVLLSQCEAHLQVNRTDTEIQQFVTEAKKTILEKCRGFLQDDKLGAHQKFLHRLSRRRVRDPRLKIFTTNYDLCFERAAGLQGIFVNDGFSLTQPRIFDPRFFDYDIVRRKGSLDTTEYLEGVFHLLKLHGSVNWARSGDNVVEEKANAMPEEVCLIYPAAGKYQQSYVQPHLETFSRFASCVREPNTCLLVLGFGFNDLHLAEPILAAVQTNSSFRLIVVDYKAEESVTDETGATSQYWKNLVQLAEKGDDIFLINSAFGEFVEFIPDLRALTPAQQLEKAIKRIGST